MCINGCTLKCEIFSVKCIADFITLLIKLTFYRTVLQRHVRAQKEVTELKSSTGFWCCAIKPELSTSTIYRQCITKPCRINILGWFQESSDEKTCIRQPEEDGDREEDGSGCEQTRQQVRLVGSGLQEQGTFCQHAHLLRSSGVSGFTLTNITLTTIFMNHWWPCNH